MEAVSSDSAVVETQRTDDDTTQETTPAPPADGDTLTVPTAADAAPNSPLTDGTSGAASAASSVPGSPASPAAVGGALISPRASARGHRSSMSFGSEIGSLGDLSDDATEFKKTLSSDVSAEHAMDLLRHVHGFEPIFGELFESADLPACNSILSVLTFAPGERIITAGEEATFAALLLEGEVIAQVAPHIQVPLVRSSWVGEMALFERGARSADITARTSAVLAVLSYEDLERLTLNGQAELQNKFTMLLAMHSIKKLRLMAPMQNVKPASPVEPAADKDAAEKDSAEKEAEVAPGRKQETLFKERLKKQSEALAEKEAKQKVEMQNMQKLVKKKVVEAEYAHATVKHKITKLESENRELLVKCHDLNKKLVAEKKRVREATELAARAVQDKVDALATIPNYELKLEAERGRYSTLEVARAKGEAAYEAKLKGKDEDIVAGNMQLANEKHMAQQAALQHEAVVAAHQPVVVERDKLHGDVLALREKVLQTEHARDYAEFQSKKLREEKVQLDAECAGWRRKCQDLLEKYDKLVHKYRIDMFEAAKEKKRIAQAHKTYHKLIRMLSLKTYVRNFLLRRFLFNIHLRVSEMVVHRWEEKLENSRREIADSGAGRPARSYVVKDSLESTSLYQQLTNATNKNKQLAAQHGMREDDADPAAPSARSSTSVTAAPHGHPNPLLAPYSFSASLASTSDVTNPASEMSVFSYTSESETQHVPKEQLRWEKKKYLLSLKSQRNPPPSITSLLQSIEEELVELKTPVDEMNLSIAELRATLDSFFKRNIQLTTKCLNTKKALEVACANYEALKNSVRARHKQDHGGNPFSQHLLLEQTSKLATSRKGGHTASPDEKEDSVSLSPPGSARSFSAGSASARARSTPSTGGEIDWAALDHEKSSGYGVTRPHVRRESRIVVPSGSSLARTNPGATVTAPVGATATRRPSGQLTPRPPAAPSSSPAHASPHAQHAHTHSHASTFALPKVVN